MKKTLLIIVGLCLGFMTTYAQPNEAAIEAQRSQMKKLERMVGQWQGSGWIQQGADKQNFNGTETVQSKLDGLALLVEGKFKSKGSAKENEKVINEKVIHETLAVLSYNAKSQNFDFQTYLANGMGGKHELKITENGFEWGFQFPNGSTRYLIKVSNDVWFETGEFSMDGKTWKKFFEMELKRVK